MRVAGQHRLAAGGGAEVDPAQVDRQGADGAWPPNWNWLGLFPEDWPQAELEWKGVLTLQTLLTLRSYGRLPFTPLSTSTTPA